MQKITIFLPHAVPVSGKLRRCLVILVERCSVFLEIGYVLGPQLASAQGVIPAGGHRTHDRR